MSARFRAVAALELRTALRRPLFWIWIAILVLLTWGLSDGDLRIQSGDSTVGGTKAWITSQFANAQILAIFVPLFYGFFAAIGAGMSILRDEELHVGPVLHATPLTAREYVWGKFTSLFFAFLVVLGLHLVLAAFFNHALAGAEEVEFIGPFQPWNYLWPALLFAVPTLMFLAGASFWIGERTRRPVLVFLLPITQLLVCLFFLWQWSPSWLDPRIDRVLMWLDPAGVRWLNGNYLDVDRGVEFYNTAALVPDLPFALSRVAFFLLGLSAVFFTRRHFERTLRGQPGIPRNPRFASLRNRKRKERALRPLPDLGMRSKPRGFVATTLQVMRAELRELWSQPGLYLFIPIIVLETIANSTFDAQGAFETKLILTPGLVAVRSMGWLTTCSCLLLVFYLVESLRRERDLGLAAVGFATPVRTSSLLLGKNLAGSSVALVVIGVTLVTAVIVQLVQGDVSLGLSATGVDSQASSGLLPYGLLWGALLLPTVALWSAFVTFLYSLTGSRYATYGLGLGALMGTLFKLLWGETSWATNWTLWGSLQWSDLGIFELDREVLIVNRIAALGAALFLFVWAVRLFPRRGRDSARTLVRLTPLALLGSALRLAPWAVVPVLAMGWLSIQVDAGFQSDAADKAGKDYWRKNVETWRAAKNPDIARVDVELEIEPERRWFRVDGEYELVNNHEEPLARVALTRGLHWSEQTWRMNGELLEPEDREGLIVFTPDSPLLPSERLTVGFAHEGTFPDGATKNGGGTGEFILPSGVVLTNFSPSFAPVVGFVNGIGVDEDNSADAKVYPDDHYEGVTRSAFGGGLPYPARVQITAPAEYTMNSVGTLTENDLNDTTGKRTVTWETEEPVLFFNVVGGRWKVRRHERTAVFYHPEHEYNVDEMLLALDGALEHYSEWFYPYPWDELKLSEFPALAGYAQGFPTNIPFSEQIGFLTKSDEHANAAFLVTAHEAAHQWWANILCPGEGPGGNLLSEGTSHFSTILLQEEELGAEARIEFCKRIENVYAESRVADSEQPLNKVDGSRPGDTTLTYDKMGWVCWMLLQHMGREANLEGIRSFIAHYRASPDHPVIEDFVRHLRDFAPDREAYDAFCEQWFFEVVVNQYKFEDVERVDLGDGTWEVRGNVHNVGTGHMPLEIAATRGERFPEEPDDKDFGEEDFGEAREEATEPEPGADWNAVLAAEGEAEPYQEARTEVVLGADETVPFTLTCDFEPTLVLVDPDALVLQLQRKHALERLDGWQGE